MTLGKRGQNRNVSRQRRFMISDEQKEKMHVAAQEQLVQASDVLWELQKKQWRAAARQRRAAVRERRSLLTEEHGKSQTKCRQKNRMEEWKTYLHEQSLLDRSHVKQRKNADGGVDHLLILAQSAELLLESEDNFHCAKINAQGHEGSQINPTAPQLQNQLSSPNLTDQEHMEKPLDATAATHGNANVEAGKNTSLLRGRIRLSQFRRQARLRNHQIVQETDGNHTHEPVDYKSFEDTDNVERVATGQVQEARGHQDVEALVAKCYSQMVEGTREGLDQQCAAVPTEFCSSQMVHETQEDKVQEQRGCQCYADHPAQGQCKQIECRRKQPLLAESLQRNDEGWHQPTMQHHINTHQLVQISNRLGELGERKHIAPQLRLLRTNNGRDPSRKHLSALPQEQVHALVKNQIGQTPVIEAPWLLQMSEMQEDYRFIARQRRMLRIFERRKNLREKHRSASLIQGHFMADEQKQIFEAEQQWLWHMSNVQNGQFCEVKQQWPFHMSNLEREHHCMAAQQRRAQWIEEQRASLDVHKCFDSHQPSEEKRFDGWTLHLHTVTGAEQDGLRLEVNNDIQQPIFSKCHKVKANVEVEKKSKFAKGRTRLNKLRSEARLRNAHLVERKRERQVDHQSEEAKNCDARIVEWTGAEQVQEEYNCLDNEGEESKTAGGILP